MISRQIINITPSTCNLCGDVEEVIGHTDGGGGGGGEACGGGSSDLCLSDEGRSSSSSRRSSHAGAQLRHRKGDVFPWKGLAL